WRNGFQHIAGVDEAGRGPLAGPVVAAAVVFPRGVLIEGVDDSKKLPEQRRDVLARVIRHHALAIGIGVVDHETIDRINILQATMRAMSDALSQLTVAPDYVLVDGNRFHHDAVRFETIVGGDAKSFSIAAASIIAKTTRDGLMRSYHQQFPQYGFDRHKGYGTRQHHDAIRRLGLCPIHRRSFRIHL
ncbi:MAG: ribonuclease HII, partial [Ignavibacteriales bacterium]|nr:ribonuclease HII [Ignavibacteriales bacterium]